MTGYQPGTNNPLSKWTDEQIVVVKDKWGKIPAKDIGALVGKTKNAVIGLAHRLDLGPVERKYVRKPRPALEIILGIPNNDNPKPKRIRVRAETQTTPPRPSAPIRAPMDSEIVACEPITLLQLTRYTCRAPVGKGDDGFITYCGAPVFAGKSWCAGHCVKFFYVDKKKAG